jgi:hypothetical protein
MGREEGKGKGRKGEQEKDLPCLTDIFVERYRPPRTARVVHAPWPITVPSDTR